ACAELNLDPYDLTVDHTFAELGATPEKMTPVIEQINNRFTVELPPDDLFTSYTTPHQLATAVATVTEDTDPEEEAAGPELVEAVESAELLEPDAEDVVAPVEEAVD